MARGIQSSIKKSSSEGTTYGIEALERMRSVQFSPLYFRTYAWRVLFEFDNCTLKYQTFIIQGFSSMSIYTMIFIIIL